MADLTEKMLQQRSRDCVNDLRKILKVNISNRNIQSIHLVRQMINIQVLSLTFNQISSLKDIQFCEKLEVLCLRSNKIDDLNQIYYLKGLPALKMLSLIGNPCTSFQYYRPTVIKNLIRLETLDDVPISYEEKKEAKSIGLNVEEPFTGKAVSFQNLQSKHDENHSLACRSKSMSLSKSKHSLSFMSKDDYVEKDLIRQMSNDMFVPKSSYTRNANLLSATLHLINELNYHCLEEVKHNVADRLDQLRSGR